MRILFIGGTGLISSAVTPLAIKQGFDLYLLNRGNHSITEFPGAKQIVADIKDEAAVRSALAGIHFDAVVDWIAFTPADCERDYRLFSEIADQFIFISSASAYSKPFHFLPLTEEHPLGNRFSDYSQNKALCEKYLFDLYENEGFPVTIVRPSQTYGGDRILTPLSGASTQWTYADRMLRGAPTVVHGDGNTLWTVTHNSDYAKAFVGLLGNKRTIGQAFHITSDEALTWNRIIEIQCAHLGVVPNIVHITSDYISAYLPRYIGPLVGDKIECAIFDNSKIKSFVPSFTCTTPYEVGSAQCIERLLAGDRVVDEAYNIETDAFVRKYLEATGL